MSKLRLNIALIFVGLFLIPQVSFATSGACSYHGGVNCSAGSGPLGNAICNDGVESSTSYYDAQECSVNRSYCIAPLKSYCTSAADFIRDCGSPSRYTQDMYNLCYADCQNQINKYQSDLARYQSCLSVQSAQQYSIPAVIQVDPIVTLKNTCIKNSGPRAKLDANQACVCEDNYMKNTAQWCMPAGDVCIQKYGTNGIPVSNTNCACANGYHLNDTQKCVEDAKPIKFIPANVKKWVDDNYVNALRCDSNKAFSEDELSVCSNYQAPLYRQKYDWEVPTTTITVTAPAPVSAPDSPPVAGYQGFPSTDNTPVLKVVRKSKAIVSATVTPAHIHLDFLDDVQITNALQHSASNTYPVVAADQTATTSTPPKPHASFIKRFVDWSKQTSTKLWGYFFN